VYFWQESVPVGHVSTGVWRSWKRCQAAGHEPGRRIEFETIGRSRIVEVEERCRQLIAAARAEMQQVAAVVHRAGMVVMLADEAGAIVQMAGDTRAHSARLRLAARQGVDLSERAAGTNAVGTALIDQSLVSIVAQEHYFESNAGLTCVAAPLFGPAGTLVGALDVSGDHRLTRPDCAELVRTAAFAVENTLLRDLRDVVLIAFSSREQLLGTPWEGLLAFDPAGQLVAANGRATALLGIAEASRTPFEDLFDGLKFGDAVGRSDAQERHLSLTSVAGLRFAACTGPARVSRSPSLPARTRPTPAAGSEEPKRCSTLTFLEVVTGDERTAKAFADARRALDHGVPVLLAGETGTGKELFARALHYSGDRSGQAFVAVNCAALPEALIEGELFGHAEGAFTGARRGGSPGRIEAADGGTLFLDEIGDMPVALQTRLLRILQERAVVRLGESRERPLDIALVCASNRSLPDLVARRLFREDLYYRISGLRVTLPPLRERTNILEIAAFFLSRHDRFGRRLQLSPSACELVLRHRWPGNLRQLDYVMTIAAAFLPEDNSIIDRRHFPDDFVAQDIEASQTRRPDPALATFDQAATELIERTVLACGGNVSAAARALKVARSTIYTRWKRMQTPEA
jgi:transcriptional regulator of acetoin/glycerol metabolism